MNLAIISRNITSCNAMHLQATTKAANIHSTTKTYAVIRTAVNLCFFYAQNLGVTISRGMENPNRILNAVGLIGRNTRPFTGNTSSRHMSVVETRPPVKNADGQTLTKTYGGLPMANTSQAPTIGQFSFSINLPENSFIKRFIAVHSAGAWMLSIETESGQVAAIQNPDRTEKRFSSLDVVAKWLAVQGIPEMSVFIPEFSKLGGAE